MGLFFKVVKTATNKFAKPVIEKAAHTAKNTIKKSANHAAESAKKEVTEYVAGGSFKRNSHRLHKSVATPQGALIVGGFHFLATTQALYNYKTALQNIKAQEASDKEKKELVLDAAFDMVSGQFGSLTTPRRVMINMIENATGLSCHHLYGLRSNKNNDRTVMQEIKQDLNAV